MSRTCSAIFRSRASKCGSKIIIITVTQTDGRRVGQLHFEKMADDDGQTE